jgi:hypothetical protein
MLATDEQKCRARQIVSETLGIYAISTPPNDPVAKFGYECALAVIVESDAVIRGLRGSIAWRDVELKRCSPVA